MKRSDYGKILAAAAGTLAAAAAAAGTYVFRQVAGRHSSFAAPQESGCSAFEEQHQHQLIEVSAFDAVMLDGYWYQNGDSHQWLLGLHDYRRSHRQLIENGTAQRFYGWGCQVLLVDMRANGTSGGDYSGLGWLDRRDVLSWVHWIKRQDPEASVILFGETMGGAAALAAVAEGLPEYVRGIVVNSPYANVYEQVDRKLYEEWGIHFPPLIKAASGVSKVAAGYAYGEGDMVRALQKVNLPVLIFQGEADEQVSMQDAFRLLQANQTGCMEVRLIPGAGHENGRQVLGEEYWELVAEFARRCGWTIPGRRQV